ncbi:MULTISPECIES: fimbrial biogenesis chaperone [unclassified Brevundimonas]|uniref:fimbrial biogenesis chaperone n=1 Tax=unclassified Brevundimonas TaxID=2622653 RepID=UPI003F918739
MLSCLIWTVWPALAVASLRVNPLVVYLTPSSSSAVVELTNVTDIDLPFEVTVMKRVVVDGEEQQIPAEDDFAIFPYQTIIPTGSSQTLRMQWLVGQAPPTSESYYVYVTQVPAQITPGVSGVRINYQFGISVHVVPPGTQPDIQITASRPAEKDGVRGVEIDVRNVGSRFARMSEQELIVDGGPTMDRAALKKAIGVGFLLPGQTNTFFIPRDGAVPDAAAMRLRHLGPV